MGISIPIKFALSSEESYGVGEKQKVLYLVSSNGSLEVILTLLMKFANESITKNHLVGMNLICFFNILISPPLGPYVY